MSSRPTSELAVAVEAAVREYLVMMDDQEVDNLYEMVLAEVEGPMIECVLEATNRNQSKTALILGLSRGTLRKKLIRYHLI